MYGHAPAPAEPAFDDARWLAAWRELDCRLDGVQSAFEASVEQILERLTPAQQHGLWGIGRQLGKLGRGAAPVQAWLMHWPEVVTQLGDDDLNDVMHLIQVLHKSPNSAAIAPLLGTLSTAARRLGSSDGLRLYLQLIEQFTQSTTGSIHGLQQTQPSPGLLPLLNQVPQLLHWLSLAGLRRWVLHGARVHARHPQHQADYFALISPDSVAMMQRQRQGHLLVDVQRQLHLSLRALWNQDISLVPLTGDDAGAARISPGLLLDALGLPDVLQDLNGVPALTRYQLMIMHAAGHRAWSGQWVADNWSPAQRLAVEWFEDLRIDLLMLKRLPGLRKPLLALLPPVNPSDCNPVEHACLRHRLAVLSRAALDDHATDCQTVMAPWVSLLKALAKPDADVAPLALSFVARTRLPSDALPQVWFEGTLWDWR
ncbi:MAG: hypothetical protein RL307_391, partial [Pseudomonadota bacterium]